MCLYSSIIRDIDLSSLSPSFYDLRERENWRRERKGEKKEKKEERKLIKREVCYSNNWKTANKQWQ